MEVKNCYTVACCCNYFVVLFILALKRRLISRLKLLEIPKLDNLSHQLKQIWYLAVGKNYLPRGNPYFGVLNLVYCAI